MDWLSQRLRETLSSGRLFHDASIKPAVLRGGEGTSVLDGSPSLSGLRHNYTVGATFLVSFARGGTMLLTRGFGFDRAVSKSGCSTRRIS